MTPSNIRLINLPSSEVPEPSPTTVAEVDELAELPRWGAAPCAFATIVAGAPVCWAVPVGTAAACVPGTLVVTAGAGVDPGAGVVVPAGATVAAGDGGATVSDNR
jgi:hypothetical protein